MMATGLGLAWFHRCCLKDRAPCMRQVAPQRSRAPSLTAVYSLRSRAVKTAEPPAEPAISDSIQLGFIHVYRWVRKRCLQGLERLAVKIADAP